MSSLKSRLVRPVHTVALAGGGSAWLARRRPARRILMLHNIAPGHFAPDLFEQQLLWLRANFRVVPLPRMIDELLAGTVVQGHGDIALTFDDGLRNHAEIAYPLLQRHSIPATFFVCPGLIDQRRWLWNQDMRARLSTLSNESLTALASTLQAGTANVEGIIAWMKTLRLTDRRHVEALIRERTPEFSPTEQQRAVFDPMSWEQLRALDSELITVGAHTLTHPILTHLSDENLETEILASRKHLENGLGRPVDIFCYPNGDNDMRARKLVREHFRGAVTTAPGIVSDDDPIEALPRIPVSPRLELMAWRLHRPAA